MKLPDSAYIHYNYVERDTLPPEYQSNYHIDYASANFLNYSLKDSDPIKFWAMKKQSDKSLKKSWFLSSIERNDLIGIQSHYLDDDPVPYVKKNGCCIPGHQRLYITTQGDFKVCERVGNTPFIGSLNEGLNIENIKKYYINEYDKKSEKCKYCWACHLCTLCYSSCMQEHGVDSQLKEEACHAMQVHLRNNLIEYYHILENNSDYIDAYIRDSSDER